MIGKGATPSFFAIANDNYTLTHMKKEMVLGKNIITVAIENDY